MNKRTTISILLLLSFVITGLGQQATQPTQTRTQQSASPSPTPTLAQTREDVVRITTNLVQVDVTVLDRSGQPVNDLTADDFEVTEDGRPQKVTNLSFVTPASAEPLPRLSVTASARPARGVVPAPPPPPVSLRPEQVRRTIALVVDDLGLSFESSHFVRQALKKFVDEQMQPGDLVAIIRTGAGMGALQQFTGDRRLLYAAIERVRYNLNSRGFSAFAPIESSTQIAGRTVAGLSAARTGDANPGNELINSLLHVTTPGAQANQYRDDIFSVGTLGALNFIIRGLRDLPGRKSIILFSDGFRMYDEDQGTNRILESLHRLVDLANRASVVIYSVDPRGLQTLGLTAVDDLSGPIAPGSPNAAANFGDPAQGQWVMSAESNLQNRRRDFFQTQQGLGYLAQQTGGFFVRNSNDISGAVRRVLNDQKGYYLLGYRPEESTVNDAGRRNNFHHIQVKVKRPDLTVRTRTGFYGFTNEEAARAVHRTPTEQLYAALTSPFASGDIHVRMSSVFGHDPDHGSFTESILHIDTHDISFTKQPDGTLKASFQILTVTFGDNGQIVDQSTRSYSIAVQEANLERLRNSGLIYIVTLPIKKPGAYQLRMAIRDATSEHVGSANQFVEIPDVKKNRLTLSGVLLGGSTPRAVTNASAAPAPSSATASNSSSSGAANPASSAVNATEGQVQEDHPLAIQATRRFQHGMTLSYGYYIYNARLNSARQPELETQMRLYRDGQLVYTGKINEFDAAGQTNMRQIAAGGALRLGTDLQPGEYVLQVIVIDKLASGDASIATQWMDFDLLD
ncbi:MAG TPA: VWA domain-containing protein [Pyrinomonadaceae bacterium]|nr:VWA domain-containing protein [Pyrinomonadaceae bacterium]